MYPNIIDCCEASRSMLSNYFCKKQVLGGTFGEIWRIQIQMYPKTDVELKYGASNLKNEVSAYKLGLVVQLSWRVAPPLPHGLPPVSTDCKHFLFTRPKEPGDLYLVRLNYPRQARATPPQSLLGPRSSHQEVLEEQHSIWLGHDLACSKYKFWFVVDTQSIIGKKTGLRGQRVWREFNFPQTSSWVTS